VEFVDNDNGARKVPAMDGGDTLVCEKIIARTESDATLDQSTRLVKLTDVGDRFEGCLMVWYQCRRFG
jgi:hypothetical protein